MFCPNPFDRLEIKSDGSVYCCCEGWLPSSLGNILTDTIEEIWNGKVATAIRQSIFDGSFRYCLSCPYLPAGGGSVTEDMPSKVFTDSIRTLKLDYDHSCNLVCPSCRVSHSRDFVDLKKANKVHEAMLASGLLKWTKRLYVTGAGDPFASDLFWNFLREVPNIEHHKDMEIFLHTNGLLFDRQHWERLGLTRELVTEAGISVDAGCEATYKLNRGASWTKLWNNINFINELQASGRPLMLGMFYTVQDNNFREIVAFVRKAFEHRVAWISITALRNWGSYSPEEYLRRAVHLPEHEDYSEFKAVFSDPEITGDRRIILDSFNPSYTWQQHTIGPGAILPTSVLRRAQKLG